MMIFRGLSNPKGKGKRKDNVVADERVGLLALGLHHTHKLLFFLFSILFLLFFFCFVYLFTSDSLFYTTSSSWLVLLLR
jgi:hypothetical protein